MVPSSKTLRHQAEFLIFKISTGLSFHVTGIAWFVIGPKMVVWFGYYPELSLLRASYSE